MPQYQYRGRDKAGNLVEGVLDAASEPALATKLIRLGVTPTNIEIKFNVKKGEGTGIEFKFGKPTLQDIAFFSRQMHALMRSGVPILRAVRVVKDSITNEFLRTAINDVMVSVEQGRTLAVSMAEHPAIFPTLMISLVGVGENTGRLDIVFQQLATHFEREVETRKRVWMAVRYPIMVVVVIVIAMGVINVVVVPAFAAFFKQFKSELPLPTRILVGVSDFTVHYWPWMLVGVFGFIWVCYSYIKSPEGHYHWDRFKIKVPIFGSILLRSILSRFARSFALCVRTGVPLLETIGLVAKTTDNLYVEENLNLMRRDIEHGESLTRAATNSKMFSRLVLQMLAIGEETGEIDRLLEDVAIFYEQEVDYDVKRLGDYIEPLLLMLMAVFVLLLALGVYLPMWDISRAAFGK